MSQTWVTLTDHGEVVAYHTLSIISFTRIDAPATLIQGAPKYAIPAILLARLAVDRSVQGQGLGGLTLEVAMRKAVALGRTPVMADGTPGLPMRAMLVHALDENAAKFYRYHGFEQSPADALHLYMLLKDIERVFAAP